MFDVGLVVYTLGSHVRCWPSGLYSGLACSMLAQWFILWARMFDVGLVVYTLGSHVRCWPSGLYSGLACSMLA